METTENDIFIACNSSTELQRKSRLNKKHKKATRKNTSNKDFNNGAFGTFIPLNHFTNLSTEELNYSNTEKNDDHCNDLPRQKLSKDSTVRRKNTKNNKSSETLSTRFKIIL